MYYYSDQSADVHWGDIEKCKDDLEKFIERKKRTEEEIKLQEVNGTQPNALNNQQIEVKSEPEVPQTAPQPQPLLDLESKVKSENNDDQVMDEEEPLPTELLKQGSDQKPDDLKVSELDNDRSQPDLQASESKINEESKDVVMKDSEFINEINLEADQLELPREEEDENAQYEYQNDYNPLIEDPKNNWGDISPSKSKDDGLNLNQNDEVSI